MIGTAERENAHDRPKDAITLMCTVLLVQHRALVEFEKRLRHIEDVLRKDDEQHPW